MVAREKLINSKERSKKHYDKDSSLPSFQVGDKILLYDETVSSVQKILLSMVRS
jgi:hypothetical protein